MDFELKDILDIRTKTVLIFLINFSLFYRLPLLTELGLNFLIFVPFFIYPSYKIKQKALRKLIFYILLLFLFYFPSWMAEFRSDFVLNFGTAFFYQKLPAISLGLRKIFPCILMASYLSSCTEIGEFRELGRKLKLPQGLIISAMVVFRFFPSILADARCIRNCLKLRGLYRSWYSFLLHPLKCFEYFLLPLLLDCHIVSRDLTVASLSKGLQSEKGGTSILTLRLSIFDYLYFFLIAALGVIIVYA